MDSSIPLRLAFFPGLHAAWRPAERTGGNPRPQTDAILESVSAGHPDTVHLSTSLEGSISEELRAVAERLGVPGPHTSWWHMFGWNVFGLLLMGPAVATHRFFCTLKKKEKELNRRELLDDE